MRLIASSMAVLALLSTPAFAATSTTPIGNDGESILNLAASAQDYCRLGQVSSISGLTNATSSTLSGGQSGANSDVALNVNLQDQNTDAVQAWGATINLPYSVCNHNFAISFTSTKGGLSYTGTQQASAGFTKLVPYGVSVSLGGATLAVTDKAIAPNQTFTSSSASPVYGSAVIQLTGLASSSYLLSGAYSDVANVTITPVA
ncbi:hypothetical protein [Novosphingobium terrae]|uniref:hypothetical protein n=1 Tax=Novosphingobium terrae TaxID=2726189 RepID=UPI00197EC472|nr:hypothetical protein [Novosphingobium terrae]